VLCRRLAPQVDYRIAQVNHEPDLLRYIDERIKSANTFVTDRERIIAIYISQLCLSTSPTLLHAAWPLHRIAGSASTRLRSCVCDPAPVFA
jgi:hypothetical protein